MKTAHASPYKYLPIFLILLQSFCSKVAASNVVYQNNFNNETVGNQPNGWIVKRNIQWTPPHNPCTNGGSLAQWTIRKESSDNKVVGIDLNGKACVIEIVPQNFFIPDPANFQYDIDLLLPEQGNILSNVAFKYNEYDSWYGLKFIGSNTLEVQKVFIKNPYIDSVPLTQAFGSNARKHISTRVKNNQIEVFIDGLLTYTKQDSEPFLSKGTIALQASIGGNGEDKPYSVSFDNIVVTDLSEPKEFVLNTPFLSQVDPLWKDLEYDTATKWAGEENETISRWGCAITSAAMTLREHGFTKGPEGQDTNPDNLNQYLNQDTVSGYNKWGGVIWSAITNYAKQAKDAGHVDQKSKLLSFSYLPYDHQQVVDSINNLQSRILKIQTQADGYHFVVAKGYTLPSKDFILNDPLTLTDSNPTLNTSYDQKPVVQVGRLAPTTDPNASYIWLAADSKIHMLLGKDGQFTGSTLNQPLVNSIANSLYFLDGKIANGDLTSPDFKTLAVEQPSSGTYSLLITSPETMLTSLDTAFYDKDNQGLRESINFLVGPTMARTIAINYNQDAISNTSYRLIADFNSLEMTLKFLMDNNLIDRNTHKYIQNQIKVATKQAQKEIPAAKTHINNCSLYIEENSARINTSAKEVLLDELTGVFQSI